MPSLISQNIAFMLIVISKRQLSHESLDLRNIWLNTYDYVVIGAGTAGSAVAARLTKDTDKYVLLIDAGKPQSVKTDIPALQAQIIGSEFDWKYQMVSQNNAFDAYIGNKLNISRGKAFGGCSMHNDMNYYRESPEYYDYWTELTGVPNWRYADVLPYFRKSENNIDDNLVEKDPTVHTTGGLLTVSTATPLDPILKAFIEVSPQLGYPITYSDGRNPFGSTIMQRNIKKGVRQSSSLVFLEGNFRQLRNLHILGQTMVTKIYFDGNKRTTGIQFHRDKNTYKVNVRNEVIVSAGTIGSPHLLMLSGIGRTQHFQDLNISIISDLNVGQFLYAPHVSTYFDVRDQTLVEKPVESYDNYYEYYVHKTGPLAYKASGNMAFRQVTFTGHESLSNGAALPRLGFQGSNLKELVKGYKMPDQWMEYYRPYLNRTYLEVVSLLKRPQGTGTIRLASTNPLDYPVIDPCYLCNEKDVTDLVQVFNLTMNFFTSAVMSAYIEPYVKPIPGCTPCPDLQFCDNYIRCILKTSTGPMYPVGGCRMGVANDSAAVVDQRLRVFGVSGLRVIDSSVLPVYTEQSSAITLMIGEYGSDMIKEDNHLKDTSQRL